MERVDKILHFDEQVIPQTKRMETKVLKEKVLIINTGQTVLIKRMADAHSTFLWMA